MPQKSNRLLDALPETTRRAVMSGLTHTELDQHRVLFDVREAITVVYFPIDAVISLVIPLSTGEIVETAMVGRDGVVGGGAGA